MNAIKNISSILTDLMKSDPATFSVLKEGDLVEGKVLSKGAREMLVDLGRHGTGVVYRGEIQDAREMVRDAEKGKTIHGKVIGIDKKTGYVVLSLAEAGRQKAWMEIMELAEKEEPITVKISGCNKGGLTTELSGLPAFVPVSQLAQEHYPKVYGEDRSQITKALEELVGQELSVKIIDANPRANKLILSEREAVEISAKELAKNYEIGQEIEGIITGVADFGAFMQFADNPILEGLIRTAELSYRIVENPKEIVSVDETIKAKIIEIKDGKINLSLKALQSDPWETAGEQMKQGEEVRGTVYSFNPFGAIVNIKGDLQGNVHVTDFGGVDEMKKHLKQGEEYMFTVEEITPAEKRITLKLKE